MPKFRSVLIFPDGLGEGRYEFEAPENFLEGSPARVVDSFLGSVQALNLGGAPVDSHVNMAFAHKESRAIVAGGAIHLNTGGSVPFILMISQARSLG
jgi:hypothetical protein